MVKAIFFTLLGFTLGIWAHDELMQWADAGVDTVG